MRERGWRAVVAAALVLLGGSWPAGARENLETERALANVMMAEPVRGEGEPEGRTWAAFPQIGYSPEKGPNAGIKLVDRDFGRFGLTVDVDAVYALEGQQKYDVTLVVPELFRKEMIGMVEARYFVDPTKEFFGLGNNEVGPDELSTHRYRLAQALFTIGGRPWPRLTLAATGGISDIGIARGELQDDTPPTIEEFPGLAGIRGGQTNPLSFSIVFNNREDVTRPTRGWSFTAKVQHVNRNLGNDFQFTRYIVDASYLRPFITRSQIVGLRVGGEFIDAKRLQVPFYELASLGGAQDLRGFFLDRFLGRSRVMINLEDRLKVVEEDVLGWRVRVDGVAFGDMGRVFAGDNEFRNEFTVDRELLPRVFRDFRYSYGGGLRIALSEAILARFDVGFSDEEKGLLYLTFGHTF